MGCIGRICASRAVIAKNAPAADSQRHPENTRLAGNWVTAVALDCRYGPAGFPRLAAVPPLGFAIHSAPGATRGGNHMRGGGGCGWWLVDVVVWSSRLQCVSGRWGGSCRGVRTAGCPRRPAAASGAGAVDWAVTRAWLYTSTAVRALADSIAKICGARAPPPSDLPAATSFLRNERAKTALDVLS